MRHAEARELISGGVEHAAGVWADLGAGSGTFARALAALLGEDGLVHAVDRSPDALRTLEREEAAAAGARPRATARIVTRVADFRQPLPLGDLDGVIMANALHFVDSDEQPQTLGLIASYLRPAGALVLVEYDQRRGAPWVPYPVPPLRFSELARLVGLGEPREIGRRRSRYGPKDLYAAVALRP